LVDNEEEILYPQIQGVTPCNIYIHITLVGSALFSLQGVSFLMRRCHIIKCQGSPPTKKIAKSVFGIRHQGSHHNGKSKQLLRVTNKSYPSKSRLRVQLDQRNKCTPTPKGAKSSEQCSILSKQKSHKGAVGLAQQVHSIT
jgi:hypothetical protein